MCVFDRFVVLVSLLAIGADAREDKLRARRRIDLLLSEIVEYFWDHDVDNDIIELRNIAMVSKLIIESALRRTESRGLHYTLDFPELGRGAPLPTRLDRRQLEGAFWLRPALRAGAPAAK